SDALVKVWDAGTGAEKWSAPAPAPDSGFAGLLAFTPDGKTLLTAGHDQTRGQSVQSARRWEAATGKELARLFLAPLRGLGCYCLSPDGPPLAGVEPTEERVVRVYDAVTGTPRFSANGHVQAVVGVAFSSDGRLLATAANDHGFPGNDHRV